MYGGGIYQTRAADSVADETMKMTTQANGGADPPIEELKLTPGLEGSLKRAQITTIGQLEAELADPDALRRKLTQIGEKNMQRLRQVVEAYRAKPPIPSVSGNAALLSAPGPTAQDPPGYNCGAGGKAVRGNRLHKRWSKAEVGYYVGLALGVLVLVLALISFFWYGPLLTQTMLYGAIVALSFGASLLLFLLTSTEALLHGTIPKSDLKFKVRGPGALFLISALLLWWSAPKSAFQSLNVYLSPVEAGDFKIVYRRPTGQGTRKGQDGYASLLDVENGADSLEVEAIECVGWIPARKQHGEQSPWKFKIDKGSVTIAMIKQKPADVSLPGKPAVRAELDKDPNLKKQVREPGKYTKDQVALTIENSTDRKITVVLCDCSTLYDDVQPFEGNKPFAWAKDQRELKRGERDVGKGFQDFFAKTGWFAIYIRFSAAQGNGTAQVYLGTFNLFNAREALLVIERSAAEGVQFRLDGERSKLKD
jgi:hypothetical protein